MVRLVLRVAAALVTSIVCSLLLVTRAGTMLVEGIAGAIGRLIVGPNVAGEFVHGSLFVSVFSAICVSAALGAYGVATRMVERKPLFGETRCRKCGYVLRGISEPRCPECGERI